MAWGLQWNYRRPWTGCPNCRTETSSWELLTEPGISTADDGICNFNKYDQLSSKQQNDLKHFIQLLISACCLLPDHLSAFYICLCFAYDSASKSKLHLNIHNLTVSHTRNRLPGHLSPVSTPLRKHAKYHPVPNVPSYGPVVKMRENARERHSPQKLLPRNKQIKRKNTCLRRWRKSGSVLLLL